MKNTKGPATEKMKALLKQAGSFDHAVSSLAMRQLAKAFTLPIKQGVLKGDIIGGIFEVQQFEDGQIIEYPLDFVSPGSERDFIAYTIPNVGRIPEQHIEGDYITVNTYDVGVSLDWALKYARQARWDIMSRVMQVLEAMFTRKANGDGWHVLLAAGTNRNIVVYDGQATSGLFTKRLVALMQTSMRRNAGGNSTSINKGILTDLFLSPESHQDILSWDLTQIPDAIRQQIFMNWDAGGVAKIGRVAMHDIDELGVGQEFQLYYTNTLGGTLPTDKVEIVVGLDLANRDSFVNPVRTEIELFDDPVLHRQRRAGMYGWREHGFAALDGRRVLFGAV